MSNAKRKFEASLVFVHDPGGDWVALYRHEKLLLQGHSLDPGHVLEALGIVYEDVNADEEWLMGYGTMPESLEDVKFED